MKDVQKLRDIRAWIQKELESSASFWLKYGMDPEHGGVYTCLDRTGVRFSTDKSVWMQGRCGWIYAYLCHVYGVREDWLRASKSCLDFMEAHCINREAGDRMYFTVTADGKPLLQRRTFTPRPTPNITPSPATRRAWSGPAGPTTWSGSSTTA